MSARSFAVVVVAALLGAASAAADGDEPRPELHWSFPSDGMAGVPTNAGLFVLTPCGTRYEATLDGVVIGAGSYPAFFPVEGIAPSTEYTVTVGLGEELAEVVSLSFATGPGSVPVPALERPVITGHTVVVEDWSVDSAIEGPSFCSDLVTSDGFFDEGPLGAVRLETTGEALIWHSRAWIEGPFGDYTAWWPAECGAPHVLTYASWPEYPETYQLCFTVTAYDRFGSSTVSEAYCPGALGEGEGEGGTGGEGEPSGDTGDDDSPAGNEVGPASCSGTVASARPAFDVGFLAAFALVVGLVPRRRSGGIDAVVAAAMRAPRRAT